jgi:hypothetical protein
MTAIPQIKKSYSFGSGAKIILVAPHVLHYSTLQGNETTLALEPICITSLPG